MASYRGDIPSNTTVKVRFLADFSNSGTAVFMVGSGPFGNDPTAKSALVAPGGSSTLDIRTPGEGIVKVVVDFREEDDSGRLEVTSGGFSDSDSIIDDQSWTYSAV
jgi:hypothetical protein